MNVISLNSTNLLDRIGASRAALAARPGASAAQIKQAAVEAQGTRVTLGQRNDDSVVYRDPRALPGFNRLWAQPVEKDDAVSAIMARNRGSGSIYELSDQWRGLGGALLTQFAKTGKDYTQTLVDEQVTSSDAELPGLAPENQAQRAADIAARQADAIANVANDAPTAGLTVKMRSGQSVELSIAVGQGINGPIGMKVAIKSSGSMSEDERAAVQKLADGLNKALEGLGHQEAASLDLSGLASYDRGAIASLDLTVNTGHKYQALESFSLHLGDDKRAVSLKGVEGTLNLNVAAGQPSPNAAALQRMLGRMDAAGERGHANAALVAQMKAAFTQLNATAPGTEGKDAPTNKNLSGLPDFEASFSGDTWRSNRFGAHNEAGQVAWQLSQKTTTEPGTRGGVSTKQTVSEQLSADYRKAPGDGMLDVTTGNFTATRIRDSSTVTTQVDTGTDGSIHVRRKTDEQQLKAVTEFANHKVVNQQKWPWQRSFAERLS